MEKTMTVKNTNKGMKSVADITRQYGLLVVSMFNTYAHKESELYRKRYKLVRAIAERYLKNLQHNGFIDRNVNIDKYLDGNQGERCGSYIKLPMECRLGELSEQDLCEIIQNNDVIQKILNKVKDTFKHEIETWIGGKHTVHYKMIDWSSIYAKIYPDEVYVEVKTLDDAEYMQGYVVSEDGELSWKYGLDIVYISNKYFTDKE